MSTRSFCRVLFFMTLALIWIYAVLPYIFMIMYMTIGDEWDSFTPHPSDKDITIIRAQKEEDVRDSLFDISSRVTGRVRVEDNDVTMIDDHTITISSRVPLLNISILVQNKSVSVQSIKDSDLHEIPIKSEIPVKMPDPSITGERDSKEMYGAVTLAGEKSGNISSGAYTITFSDAISTNDLVIMLEPALQIKIKLYIGDQEITDLDDITILTDTISAKAAIYEYGTDQVISESLLPGEITQQMTFTVNDVLVDSADKLTMDRLDVGEGENVIRATLDIEGFFHLETLVDFTPSIISNIDRIDAELSYDGSERFVYNDGSKDGENIVYVSRLHQNRTGIRFTVYQDGAPISHLTAKSLEEVFRRNLQVDFSNYEVELQNDGSFLVYPTDIPWIIPMEVFYLQHQGEQKIGVKLDDASAEGTIEFKLFGSVEEAISRYLIVILFIYLIWWILFKKHFPKCTLVCGIGKLDYLNKVKYRESERVDMNWFGCFHNSNIFSILLNLLLLLLPMASRTKFCGYTFIGQSSFVKRVYSLLVRNVRGKAVDTSIPKPREISQEPTVEMGDTLFIREGAAYLKFYIEQ